MLIYKDIINSNFIKAQLDPKLEREYTDPNTKELKITKGLYVKSKQWNKNSFTYTVCVNLKKENHLLWISLHSKYFLNHFAVLDALTNLDVLTISSISNPLTTYQVKNANDTNSTLKHYQVNVYLKPDMLTAQQLNDKYANEILIYNVETVNDVDLL